MQETVTVACAQVEPVVFDLNATIDRIDQVAAEATGKGAKLVLFPEAYIPAYPSNRWARYLAAGQDAKGIYAKLARSSVEIPGPASDRLGSIAREHGLLLATGANELDGGTIYKPLLLYEPDGSLALH